MKILKVLGCVLVLALVASTFRIDPPLRVKIDPPLQQRLIDPPLRA